MSDGQYLALVFPESEIQYFMVAGKLRFVGHTVSRALGYKSPYSAIKSHCRDAQMYSREKMSRYGIKVSNRGVLTISEGDMYRLIIRSRLPEARKFERKLFDEILPCIRKYGSYSLLTNGPVDTKHQLIAPPPKLSPTYDLLAIGQMLTGKARDTFECLDEMMNPSYSAVDARSIKETAEKFSITEDELIDTLVSWEWVYRRGSSVHATKEALRNGRMKEPSVMKPLRIMPSGLIRVRRKFAPMGA